jgi:hypothetical protein
MVRSRRARDRTPYRARRHCLSNCGTSAEGQKGYTQSMSFRIIILFVFFLFPCLAPVVTEEAPPIAVEIAGPAGPYSLSRWKHDWPGCGFEGGVKEGRTVVTENAGRKWLRVNFAKGQIGPEKGGAGWRWPIDRRESAELTYTLRFSQDFDWVKGGKLPGLCGGPENVSGGRRSDGSNGFSARLMWRRDGRGEAYVYHKNQEGDYGDSFDFPDDFRFPTDQPVTVRMRVTMNTPSTRDGNLRVWIRLEGESERLMVERSDLEWRSASTFGVDGFYFETFHGGGDRSWAPTKPCWVEFSGMKIEPAK